MEHQGFLRDIWDHPDDDTLRLVYADWLEENGDAARAEFIRVQCELAKIDSENPRTRELFQREDQLLEEHRGQWTPPLPKPLADRVHATFQRGLLHSLYVADARDEDALLLVGVSELRALSLEGQGFTDAGLVFLLGFPQLEELGLKGTAVTDEGMRIVGQLQSLRRLNLYGTPVTDAGLQHLHSLPYLRLIHSPEGITAEGLEHWKERRMERFRELPLKERREEAVAALRDLSGRDLGRREDGRFWACLSQCSASDADLEYFTTLPEVEEIDLYETRITSQGLRHLSGLKRLRTLNLTQTRVNDLAALAGLARLEHLQAGLLRDENWNFCLNDRGTPALATLTGLQSLDLCCASITDATLRHLAGLSHLRVLDLRNVDGVGDEGLAALAGLARLEILRVSRMDHLAGGVTDEGLRSLGRLTQLRVLDLKGQPITDAGLLHLSHLKELEALELNQTQVTVQGAHGLLAHLPKVSIIVAGTMVKHVNPRPRFARRDAGPSASFEVPDDWEVLRWGPVEQEGDSHFWANVREDGYKHRGSYTISAGPGEVWIYQLASDEHRALAEIHLTFVRGTNHGCLGEPGDWVQSLPGTETLSWRYGDEHEQFLDVAWRRPGLCYLIRCSSPVGRFAGLEPFFLRMARSFWFTADGPPPEPLP